MNYYLAVLKKYAVFSGRARRSEYWYFQLVNIIILFALAFLGAAMRSNFLYYIYWIATLVPSIAVSVRRMHDVNKSGAFIFVPIYNLILACTNGTVGPNRYGADPKRPEFEEFLNDDSQSTAQPL